MGERSGMFGWMKKRGKEAAQVAAFSVALGGGPVEVPDVGEQVEFQDDTFVDQCEGGSKLDPSRRRREEEEIEQKWDNA